MVLGARFPFDSHFLMRTDNLLLFCRYLGLHGDKEAVILQVARFDNAAALSDKKPTIVGRCNLVQSALMNRIRRDMKEGDFMAFRLRAVPIKNKPLPAVLPEDLTDEEYDIVADSNLYDAFDEAPNTAGADGGDSEGDDASSGNEEDILAYLDSLGDNEE